MFTRGYTKAAIFGQILDSPPFENPSVRQVLISLRTKEEKIQFAVEALRSLVDVDRMDVEYQKPRLFSYFLVASGKRLHSY